MRVSQKASHTEVERVSEEDVMHGERKGADTLAREISLLQVNDRCLGLITVFRDD